MAQAARAFPRLAMVAGPPAMGAPGGGRRWWGAYMDDEAYVRLIREIEVERGRVSAHEMVCAERYKRIDEKLGFFQESFDKLVESVTKGDDKNSKWKDRIVYTTIAVLFAWA